ELRAGKIASARLAYGGMSAVPQRARQTEAALIGKSWSAASIESASTLLARDFQPLDDMRASSAYRLHVAANLLRRFYFEQTNSHAPWRVAMVAADTM